MKSEDLKKSDVYIGKSILFPKNSIQVILDNLGPNERLLLITPCNAEGKPGALGVTDKRVIFGSKVLFSRLIKDFDIKKITSLTYASDMTNRLSIIGASDKIEISAIDKEAGQKIVNQIKGLQTNEHSDKSKPADSLGNLEKLAELKEKGIITEDEFNQSKKKILGLLD